MNKELEKLLFKLDQFLKSFDRNMWISNRDIKIYVRKGIHVVTSDRKMYHFIDLASIEVGKPNRGIFTKTLAAILEKYPDRNFFIESVLNPAVDTVAAKFGFEKQIISPESYNFYLLSKQNPN